MKQITSISDDVKQTMTFVLDDGSKVNLSLQYISANQGWFMSLVYGTVFSVSNRRIVNSPNMLRAFRNVIPFGIACIVTDGLEPIYQTDFSSLRATLYILNSTDIAYIENTILPSYR